MEKVLREYYEPHYQLRNLTKMHKQKIVFMNGLAELN